MTEQHVVAIVGGATAGAEAAAVLAERGVRVVVFEQNARPFGKIEDGLPRWHQKQRVKEYENIGEKLKSPGVHFVPLTRLGRDMGFGELVGECGFSAILLANGAWRDRPLPVPDVDRYVDRGLVYQNTLVYWFNHYNEASYDGPHIHVPDGAIVIGGGLASLDVVKICMIETVQRALRARGIDVDMHTLERKGALRVVEEHGLTLEALGVEPCTLYYRRRAIDMPIADVPEDAPPEVVEKRKAVRAKILDNLASKHGFRFAPLHAPHSLIIEDDRCVGVRFWHTEQVDGRLRTREDLPLVEVRGALTISSIGSVPEPIAGIEMDGEYYRFTDEETGEYRPIPGVFGLGNVITGRGNIKVSQKHGRHIAERVARGWLGLEAGEGTPTQPVRDAAHAVAEEVARYLESRPPLTDEQVSCIMERVERRQREVGYDDFDAWLARHTPPDRE